MPIPISYGAGTASVASEKIGNNDYQQIKVVGAETGSTSVMGVNPDRSINVSVVGAVQVTGSIVTVGNGSVSGTLGASVIGWVPIQPSNTSTISYIQNSVATVIIGGSVAATFTPPANQSVSGTVDASIIGWVPIQASNTSIITVSQSSSIVGVVTGSVVAIPTGNQSVSGALFVSGSVMLGNSNASVITVSQNSSIIAINAGSVVTISQGSVITVWQAPSIAGTYAEDAAHTTADRGLFTLGVRNDTVASFVSANGEYTAFGLDSAGRTVTKPFSPEESRIEGYNSVVSTSVTTLVAAAGAGLRNYITDIMIANSGATTTIITFKDGAGSVLGYTIAPTGGGSNMIGMAVPMRTGANATFDFQPTAASSIIYATVKGFKAP